jgi:hypothetical protein
VRVACTTGATPPSANTSSSIATGGSSPDASASATTSRAPSKPSSTRRGRHRSATASSTVPPSACGRKPATYASAASNGEPVLA